MAGNSADSGRTVTSKSIGILLLFAQGSDYSLSEIARLAGLPVSTAHRLVIELAAAGILERTDDGHYSAGAHLRVINAQAVEAPPPIQEKARRVMEDLSTATARTTVRLGVLRDGVVDYVEKLPGTRPVPTFADSATAPAHASAMGKALLAFSGQHAFDRVVARGLAGYTPFTLTRPELLRRALAVTRLTRVAVCRRELDLEASAVAVPVFGIGGEVAAALELEIRDLQDLRRMQPPLVVAARALSREITSVSGGLGISVGANLCVDIRRSEAIAGAGR